MGDRLLRLHDLAGGADLGVAGGIAFRLGAAEQLEVGVSDRLFPGNAGDRGPRLVDVFDAQIVRLDEGRHRQFVEHVPEQVDLAHRVAQRLFAPLELGDVDAHPDERAVVGTHVVDLVPAAVGVLAFELEMAKMIARDDCASIQRSLSTS